MNPDRAARSPWPNRSLWILQALLAALFLFAGVMKFLTPVEQMNAGSPVQLPGAFLRFVGACEVLGALGLVLPAALSIRPGLTPLAAAGLIVLMLGAVGISLIGGAVTTALFPLVVAVLLAVVARQRRSRG